MELQEVFFRGVAIAPIPFEQSVKDFREETTATDYRNGYVAHLLKIIHLFEPTVQIDFSQLDWIEGRSVVGYFDYYINDITLKSIQANDITISAYGQSGFHYASDGTDYLGITIYLKAGRFVHCTVESETPLLQVKLTAEEIAQVSAYVEANFT